MVMLSTCSYLWIPGSCRFLIIGFLIPRLHCEASSLPASAQTNADTVRSDVATLFAFGIPIYFSPCVGYTLYLCVRVMFYCRGSITRKSQYFEFFYSDGELVDHIQLPPELRSHVTQWAVLYHQQNICLGVPQLTLTDFVTGISGALPPRHALR